MNSPAARHSDAALQMLEATRNARNAFANEKKQQALQDVDRAIKDAGRVQNGTNNQAFVPLYQELDRSSVLKPMLSARSRNSQTAMNGSSQRDRSSQNATNQNDTAANSNTAKNQRRGQAARTNTNHKAGR